MVVTQPQPTGHAVADAPEAFADALADRLQGLEAGPALGGMKTDALGRAVVNGHEDKGWPLGDGHRGRHVRTPHYVGRLSGDGPVVRLRPVRVTRALRGLEVVLPQPPQREQTGVRVTPPLWLQTGPPTISSTSLSQGVSVARADDAVVLAAALQPRLARGQKRSQL